MASHGRDERHLDPGTRLVLEELRDLRVEMRADRQRADAERRKADEAWREERRSADEQFRQERLRSDERFDKVMREMQRGFRETRQAFKDIRAVGLSIVKTLNHHTRLLERIERKLGAPGRWRPGQGNGRGGQR